MMSGEVMKLVENEIRNNLRLDIVSTSFNTLEVTLAFKNTVISHKEIQLVERQDPDPRSQV